MTTEKIPPQFLASELTVEKSREYVGLLLAQSTDHEFRNLMGRYTEVAFTELARLEKVLATGQSVQEIFHSHVPASKALFHLQWKVNGYLLMSTAGYSHSSLLAGTSSANLRVYREVKETIDAQFALIFPRQIRRHYLLDNLCDFVPPVIARRIRPKSIHALAA